MDVIGTGLTLALLFSGVIVALMIFGALFGGR